MKSNNPLPCFQKTIVLDSAEYTMIKSALSFVVATVPVLTDEELKTISNIASKLNAETHPHNN